MTAEPDGAPPAPPEAGPPEVAPPAPTGTARAEWPRRVQVSLLMIGCAAIVAVNLYVILGGLPRAEARVVGPGASGAAQLSHHGEHADLPLVDAGTMGDPQRVPAGTMGDPQRVPAGTMGDPQRVPQTPPADAGEASAGDVPPSPDKPSKRGAGGTVERAGARSCSTAQIDGLSRQIVAEARCLDASAFALVPRRRNLESAGHVFLYLDAPARDHLIRVLDAHPNRVMKVHSALRTVAQQYLLSRWAAGKRCGIQLATRPGESNHETGLALDISEHGAWRSALESDGFRWLGAIDRVHFDFVGPGATHHDGLDVQAFQRLWNRNHPEDTLSETGRYDASTEQRLKRSPAAGFPIGARCGRAR